MSGTPNPSSALLSEEKVIKMSSKEKCPRCNRQLRVAKVRFDRRALEVRIFKCEYCVVHFVAEDGLPLFSSLHAEALHDRHNNDDKVQSYP
jgi:transposase-like protein